jgi:hypothetical protein
MATVDHTTHGSELRPGPCSPIVATRCSSADTSLEAELIDIKEKMHIADDLNGGLKWCEDHVAVRAFPAVNPIDPLHGRLHIRQKPAHLRQMYFMYHDDGAVTKLLSYFTGPVHYSAGER